MKESKIFHASHFLASVARMERSEIREWGGFLDCSRIQLRFMRDIRLNASTSHHQGEFMSKSDISKRRVDKAQAVIHLQIKISQVG